MGWVEPGGAEGIVTANETSVGQSILRPHRVSIRFFLLLFISCWDTEAFQHSTQKKSMAQLVVLSELCTTKSQQ